jgi:photosynthetic reaction center H subunit
MKIGAITSYIDVAQLVLYGFWIFFIGLVIYLRREDKREGYPLESDRSARSPRVKLQGFPAMPSPKTFMLANGRTVTAPDLSKDQRELHAEPVAAWPGAPLQPTGNPLLDGVGPAAYVERANHPEHTIDGLPMIVPMRVATDYSVATRDPDPRGMDVVGGDGMRAGVVRDLWVDRAEPQVRYLQVEVPTANGSRDVLVPMTLVRVDTWRRQVKVNALLAAQFTDAPGLSNPDQVTLAEEDRITAYFAGGKLYAEPSRFGPWL